MSYHINLFTWLHSIKSIKNLGENLMPNNSLSLILVCQFVKDVKLPVLVHAGGFYAVFLMNRSL